MKIFKKTIIAILILCLFLLIINSAYAENSTDIDCNKTCETTFAKTYTDLNKQINDSMNNDVLKINDSYKYDSNNDSDLIGGVNITKNLTILGENNAYIDGSELARCLFIDSNCSVTIENMTFKNGYSENHGAGIFLSADSKLILKNCIFEYNKVYNSDGGAIDGEQGTLIEIYNSQFFNNTSKRKSDLEWEEYKVGMGSAICTRINSTLRVYDSVFKGNDGYLTTVLVISYDDIIKKISSLLIKNCLFESNRAISSGVIYLDEFGKGEILDSVFKNNYVSQRSGMVLLDASQYALVKNCTFENNSAIKGGAIYIKVFEEKYGANVFIEDCDFINNNASTFGGAIYAKSGTTRVNNCKFTGNYAQSHGGAIASLTGTLKISNSTFEKNTSPYGGALFLKSDECSVISCKFVSNIASENGGAIYSKVIKVTSSDCIYMYNSKTQVYGVFNAKITLYPFKSKKTKVKIKLTSPWKVSCNQKIKVTFKGSKSYTTKWLKTDSNGKISIKVPLNIKKSKYSIKITMKNGIGNVKTTVKYKDTGKFKITKKVKKSSKIKITVKNSYTGKIIKNTKFKVKIYTGKSYKTMNVKSNAKGILKINTKKLTKGSHKLNVILSNSNYNINKNLTVKIK